MGPSPLLLVFVFFVFRGDGFVSRCDSWKNKPENCKHSTHIERKKVKAPWKERVSFFLFNLSVFVFAAESIKNKRLVQDAKRKAKSKKVCGRREKAVITAAKQEKRVFSVQFAAAASFTCQVFSGIDLSGDAWTARRGNKWLPACDCQGPITAQTQTTTNAGSRTGKYKHAALHEWEVTEEPRAGRNTHSLQWDIEVFSFMILYRFLKSTEAAEADKKN